MPPKQAHTEVDWPPAQLTVETALSMAQGFDITMNDASGVFSLNDALVGLLKVWRESEVCWFTNHTSSSFRRRS